MKQTIFMWHKTLHAFSENVRWKLYTLNNLYRGRDCFYWLNWAESSSDLFLSPVVCRPAIWKLSKFSSSSPAPLDQFQPKWAPSILWWWELKAFSNEGPRPFPRADNKEVAKIDWRKESSFPEPLGQFHQNLTPRILGLWRCEFVQMKDDALCQGKISIK